MKNATTKNPSVNIFSPYASLFVKPIQDFTVEVGARYNHHSRYGENFTYSFNPSYFIKKRWKIFFNLSSGFKAPSLYQLYGQYGSNENLKPEKSNSAEGGVQWFSADRKINLRAVWFDRKIENVIIYTAAYQYDNFDQQHDHGIEIEPSFRFSDQVSVQLQYTYVTGKVKTTRAGEMVEYNNLLRRPKDSFGANVNYQITRKLFTSVHAKTFSKRSDQYFDLNDFSVKSVTLNEYYLVNFYAEYQLGKDRIKLFADVKNIFNQKYEEVYGYSTFGANAMLGVNMKL
jgi:Outer membrane cobalamin receptor protein